MAASTVTDADLLEAKARRRMAEVANLPPARGFDGQAYRTRLLAECDQALDEWLAAR